MDDLSIKSERRGNVSVVTVSGRVDSVTAASLDMELGKMAHTNNKLVLDLNEVEYLSSAGVRAILGAMQIAQKTGGEVRLARLPNLVAEVLQTVGVMERLQAYSSVEEAVAGF